MADQALTLRGAERRAERDDRTMLAIVALLRHLPCSSSSASQSTSARAVGPPRLIVIENLVTRSKRAISIDELKAAGATDRAVWSCM